MSDVDPDYPHENIFGKMRGRYDEALAQRVVKALRQQTLDGLWALSDADLAWLITAHDSRNKTGTNRLRMTLDGGEDPCKDRTPYPDGVRPRDQQGRFLKGEGQEPAPETAQQVAKREHSR